MMSKGAAASTGVDRVQYEMWESCWIRGISMAYIIMVPQGSRDVIRAVFAAVECLTKSGRPLSLTVAGPTCITREATCRLALGEGPPCLPTMIQLANGGGWMWVHARACMVPKEAICRH